MKRSSLANPHDFERIRVVGLQRSVCLGGWINQEPRRSYRPASRVDSPCHGYHREKVFGRDKLKLLADRELECRNSHVDAGNARVAHTDCTAIVRRDLARRCIDSTCELRKMIGWLTPADSDLTQDPLAQNKLVAVMNGLGAEGCKTYLTELTNGLLTEAAQRGMNHEDVTPAIAKSLILTAIRRFERKFPEGLIEQEVRESE